MTTSKYFWPASAITEEDMLLLYRARETGAERTTISELLARAVRETYGHLAATQVPEEEQQQAA